MDSIACLKGPASPLLCSFREKLLAKELLLHFERGETEA